MKIGYARVSTHDQNVTLQLDALKQAGCEHIYQEKVSGAMAIFDGWKLTALIPIFAKMN